MSYVLFVCLQVLYLVSGKLAEQRFTQTGLQLSSALLFSTCARTSAEVSSRGGQRRSGIASALKVVLREVWASMSP